MSNRKKLTKVKSTKPDQAHANRHLRFFAEQAGENYEDQQLTRRQLRSMRQTVPALQKLATKHVHDENCGGTSHA
jgi:hypothetical protein